MIFNVSILRNIEDSKIDIRILRDYWNIVRTSNTNLVLCQRRRERLIYKSNK